MSETGRIFAIGDIHGCRIEFEHLLQKLSLKNDDQLVLLGDLINRGPDSKGVLGVARQLPNVRCLIGNHELRLLQYRSSSDPTKLKPYDWDTIYQLSDADWNFISTFESHIEFPEIETLLVHGGFVPWTPWQDQPLEDIVNIQVVDERDKEYGKRSHLPKAPSWQDLWKGPPFVVCGHTPRKEVYKQKSSICIDTGCVYGTRLTAFELKSKQIIQVAAYEDYVSKNPPVK
ncbi:metallophosphoesterase [Rubellicoccus peritrichatus]|uniref:Metallophosphoesterase n=1 Tax=Rubellicoccus peritrichatus TaxID=3080537 RepID=A0AAQ3L8P0_9BACT|nr:metallophosphoesterase [Puniceicoccus sp. CR14]WOO40707.1 metallophosphoesterase [Puniceicoccus sp. CR14]